MAETTKKFLDFTGLQQYDTLLKTKFAADIKVVQDDLDTRLIKDTANSETISWTKGSDGTYTASVKGVVLDNADYDAVKTKATQSAAAWTKFLEGITDLYPDSVAPALKDLATKTETNNALASAKSYADGLVKDAEGNVKFDAKGAAAQALVDAKAYTDGKVDGKFDAAGSAATAKTEAISEAKTYTDGEIKKVNDAITSINTSIAGGVHFIGISSSAITDGGTETPTIDGWTGPVKTGDIVINGSGEEFIWDGSVWQKLGDTTAEQERLTSLEGHVNTLIGDENKAGSVKKALKDAKDYADGKIDTLVGPTGQVGKNTAAIAVLNGADTVEGSVDYKIAQAVSNIEASIDTIPESDINSLFSK